MILHYYYSIELFEQSGRVAVITGGNRGIGLNVVEKLLKCNISIVMGTFDIFIISFLIKLCLWEKVKKKRQETKIIGVLKKVKVKIMILILIFVHLSFDFMILTMTIEIVIATEEKKKEKKWNKTKPTKNFQKYTKSKMIKQIRTIDCYNQNFTNLVNQCRYLTSYYWLFLLYNF